MNTRDEPRRCIHGRTEKQACAACNENTEDRTEEIAREYAAQSEEPTDGADG